MTILNWDDVSKCTTWAHILNTTKVSIEARKTKPIAHSKLTIWDIDHLRFPNRN